MVPALSKMIVTSLDHFNMASVRINIRILLPFFIFQVLLCVTISSFHITSCKKYMVSLMAI